MAEIVTIICFVNKEIWVVIQQVGFCLYGDAALLSSDSFLDILQCLLSLFGLSVL